MRRFAIVFAAALAVITFKAEVSEAASYAYAQASVNCRAEPHIHSYIISVIPAGAPLEVYGSVGSWYEVDCGPAIGYVHASLVGFEHYAYAPHYVAPDVIVVPRAHRVKPRTLRRHRTVTPRVHKPRRVERPHKARPRHQTRRNVERRTKRVERPRAAKRQHTDSQRRARGYSQRSGRRAQQQQSWGGSREARRGRSGGSRSGRRWQGSHLPEAPAVSPARYAAYVDGVRILTI